MRRFVWVTGVAVGLCLLGLLALLAGRATAAGYTWTTYDLSKLGASPYPAYGRPAVIADPVDGATDVFMTYLDPEITEMFAGDGASGQVAYSQPSTLAGGTQSEASSTALKDPQTGDLLVIADSRGAVMHAYDRSAAGSWSDTDISSAAQMGVGILGSPSSTVVRSSNTISVLGQGSNDDLIVMSRDATGAWSYGDVSTAVGGQQIANDPRAFSDPSSGTLDGVATSSGGHLLFFQQSGSNWTLTDLTATGGGQTVVGTPMPSLDTQTSTLTLFAQATNGDLIQWTRASGGSWSSRDITTLAGGPVLTSNPAVSTDPDNGSFAIFGEGPSGHLIEYTGSGTSWSATDLTAADGAPTIAADPTAAISPSTGDLAVWAQASSGDLVEVERAAAASAPPPATTTQTSTSVTPPVAKPGVRTVRVKMTFKWRWSQRATRLLKFGLGALVKGSSLSVRCYGKHCPFRLLSAKWGHIGALEKRLDGKLFGVGDRIDIALSEPGRRAERVRATMRARRQPLLALI